MLAITDTIKKPAATRTAVTINNRLRIYTVLTAASMRSVIGDAPVYVALYQA